MSVIHKTLIFFSKFSLFLFVIVFCYFFLLLLLRMKVSVRVKGEWFAVPVPEPETATVRWLGEEAFIKLQKHRIKLQLSELPEEDCYEIRRAKGSAILDPEDLLVHVLDDNDFVSISEFTIFNLAIIFLSSKFTSRFCSHST